jgi:7-cyano-7-deazaguanine reductase
MGECASKFCVGSIFPFVEIRLRIAPRSTFTVCTGTDLRPEKTGISNAAAITPMTSQLQRRPLFPFELFSEANLFSSRARQEFAQATIYHPKARETPLIVTPRVCLDAAGYGPGAEATINSMPKTQRYTPEHAAAGLDADFPEIETWPNQFPGYEILVDDPEFTSVCPKTGLPDFGVLTIRYVPDKHCLELKSLKEYLHTYRNLGIFQENIVNRVLEDVVRWAKPVWAEVKGDFRPRGGISTTVIARWPRPKKGKRG